MPEVEIQLLIRTAKQGSRYGDVCGTLLCGLHVAESAALRLSHAIPRETRIRLAVIGKGDKDRHALFPADVAERLRRRSRPVCDTASRQTFLSARSGNQKGTVFAMDETDMRDLKSALDLVFAHIIET